MTGRQSNNKPPQFSSNIVATHKFRFTSFSGSKVAITVGDILGAIGGIGTSATTVASIASAFQIQNIQIWAPPASQGSVATVQLEWAGSTNSPNVAVSDTSSSVTTPARVSSRPPKNSQASFWQNINISTAFLFQLTAPTGSIIDLTVRFVVNNDENVGTAFITTVTTAVLNVSYFLALDGPATNQFRPVALTTTF
jgi:hypothetical protein